ncbi:beta strand repeat-containing protein [Companilactobacillus nantensis]|uniref:Gram-positive cocci surface proteins LPxTG domain-containing protein n=1 Tax=Companilactobacillus nantensis DSM 16982 TaxID=1423774 RepID=A0A0R1WBF8_9LACO|nr:bacterial Ig-like domain-containing protein [Companilactobacillus nantensis]KRM15278.1 hypothetical protein FD31_GL001286 [Companilactobacillus nantensis DSM 16982]GEO64393.1 hypothetical protein LNA01_15760 [Companilactobacillus nantensis]
MRKENKSVNYPKNNQKPFKTEKLWLAVPLATASIITGLAVTTPVNAATTNSTSDVQPTTAEQDITGDPKDNNTTAATPDTAVTEASGNTNSTTGNDSTTQPTAINKTVATNTQAVVNQPVNNALQTNNNTLDKGGSSKQDNSAAQSTTGVNTDSTNYQAPSIQAVAESTSATTPVTTTTPTTKSADEIPNLSNFYVDVHGDYVPYNSIASVNVLPYSSELWKNFVGQKLFSFYIVLPSSVDSTLAWMQTGATNYAKALNDQGYVSIKSLTVSQLTTTSTGRQVFYFQPDSDAKVNASDSQTGFSSQLKMSVLIHTTADTNVKTVTINAKDDNNVDTYGTKQLPTNDILFAGIGDTAVYPHGPLYEAMPSTTFGDNWPDANIVGIASNNGAKQLKFISVSVTDKYYVRSTTAGSTTLAGVLYKATDAMDPGTTYDPTTYEQAFSKTLNANKNSWWLPSFRYVGTIPDITKLSHDATTQTFPSSVTAEPRSLDLTSTTATGNTYAFLVAKIATKLDTKNSTIDAGTAWTPDDNITFTMPSAGESATISYEKISDMTPESTVKNADGSTTNTYTDSDGTMTVTSNVDANTPGTYSVKYSYTDNQGNKTDSPVNTVTVDSVIDDSVLTPAKFESSVAADGSTWTYDKGISEIKDKSGTTITPADALSDTTNPLTVTITDAAGNILKNSDGTNATSIDTSKPGTYTINYTYGKLTASTTLNVTAAPTVSSTGDTVILGPTMPTWNPITGITLTDTNDPSISAATALQNGDLTYKVTDSTNNAVAENTIDDNTPAGKYTVNYYYKGVALPNVSSVNVENSAAAIKTEPLTADSSWTPADNVTTLTDDNNTPINIPTAFKNGSLTATTPGTDGKPVNADTIDLSKAGTYTITYTYTDAVGNVHVSKSTLTIKPTTSGSGSSTGSGNESGTNAGTGTNNAGSFTNTGSGNNNGSGTAGSNVDGNSGTDDNADSNNNSSTDNNSDANSNTDNNGNSTTGNNTDPNNSTEGNGNSDANSNTNPNNSTDNHSNSNTGNNTTDPKSNLVTEPDNTANNNHTAGSESTTAEPENNSTTISKVNNDDNLIAGARTNSANISNINLVSNTTNENENSNPQTNTNNSGKLPQTSEQSTTWITQIGLFLLTIAGVFGFRRKKDND